MKLLYTISGFIGIIVSGLIFNLSGYTAIILSILKILSIITIPWFSTLFELSALGTPLWMFFIGFIMWGINSFLLIIALDKK